MECNAGSWERFEEILQRTPPGNNGNIGKFGLFVCVSDLRPSQKISVI